MGRARVPATVTSHHGGRHHSGSGFLSGGHSLKQLPILTLVAVVVALLIGFGVYDHVRLQSKIDRAQARLAQHPGLAAHLSRTEHKQRVREIGVGAAIAIILLGGGALIVARVRRQSPRDAS